MITVVCFLLLIASVPLLGGELRRLAEVRLQHTWTIAVAFALQIAVFFIFGDELGPLAAGILHVVSYAPLMAFAWLNRHIRGMPIIATGGILNLVAISANGGVMPARYGALETAGLTEHAAEFRNSDVVGDPKLAFLGDVFAIPDAVPFANVFSVGDVLLVIGGAVLLYATTRTRLPFARARVRKHSTSESIDARPNPPLDRLSAASDQEALAVVEFCEAYQRDGYGAGSGTSVDVPMLARHLYALGSMNRSSALRFATIVKYCVDCSAALAALADRRFGIQQVELLARASEIAPARYRRDEDKLLAVAASSTLPRFETVLREWCQSAASTGSAPAAPRATRDPVATSE